MRGNLVVARVCVLVFGDGAYSTRLSDDVIIFPIYTVA